MLGIDIPTASARGEVDALAIPVIIFCTAMDLVAFVLAANAIAVPVERPPGVYAASVTAILIGAALLFLFAFVHWYEALLGHEKP